MKFGMTRGLAALIGLFLLAPAAAASEDYAAPYRDLKQANRMLDVALATSTYTSDGAMILDIPGRPLETFRGSEAIRAAYVRVFGQVDPGTPIDIEFRFADAAPRPGRHDGAYRLHATVGGRDIVNYGRFTVTLVREDGAWRIAEDRGMPATAADFDRLPAADL